jgi:hypothetical protein
VNTERADSLSCELKIGSLRALLRKHILSGTTSRLHGVSRQCAGARRARTDENDVVVTEGHPVLERLHVHQYALGDLWYTIPCPSSRRTKFKSMFSATLPP